MMNLKRHSLISPVGFPVTGRMPSFLSSAYDEGDEDYDLSYLIDMFEGDPSINGLLDVFGEVFERYGEGEEGVDVLYSISRRVPGLWKKAFKGHRVLTPEVAYNIWLYTVDNEGQSQERSKSGLLGELREAPYFKEAYKVLPHYSGPLVRVMGYDDAVGRSILNGGMYFYTWSSWAKSTGKPDEADEFGYLVSSGKKTIVFHVIAQGVGIDISWLSSLPFEREVLVPSGAVLKLNKRRTVDTEDRLECYGVISGVEHNLFSRRSLLVSKPIFSTITAYHGSEKDFAGFKVNTDTAKTGAGHNFYGAGGYFAESRDFVEAYGNRGKGVTRLRCTLGGSVLVWDNDHPTSLKINNTLRSLTSLLVKFSYWFKLPRKGADWAETVLNAIGVLLLAARNDASGGQIPRSVCSAKFFRDYASRAFDWGFKVLNMDLDPLTIPPVLKSMIPDTTGYYQLQALLEDKLSDYPIDNLESLYSGFDKAVYDVSGGDDGVYEVELKVTPDELLDWHTQIKGQSDLVKQAVMAAADQFPVFSDPKVKAKIPSLTGGSFYASCADGELHKSSANEVVWAPGQQVSNALLEHGIQGIAYMLDSVQCYVIFDESKIINYTPRAPDEKGQGLLFASKPIMSSISVYHGSGVAFNGFKIDASTRGTGEGNEVYGVGGYFTDSKEVAQAYSEISDIKDSLEARLGDHTFAYDGVSQTMAIDGASVQESLESDNLLLSIGDYGILPAPGRDKDLTILHGLAAAVSYAASDDRKFSFVDFGVEMNRLFGASINWLYLFNEDPDVLYKYLTKKLVMPPYTAKTCLSKIAAIAPSCPIKSYNEWLGDLERLQVKVIPAPPGEVYEVDILADMDDLLDLNVPIGQQSSKVQKAVENLIDEYSNDSQTKFTVENVFENTGADFYHSFANLVGGEEAMSKALWNAGIKGNTYIGEYSKTGGKGSRCYVMFDHSAVVNRTPKVAEKNGQRLLFASRRMVGSSLQGKLTSRLYAAYKDGLGSEPGDKVIDTGPSGVTDFKIDTDAGVTSTLTLDSSNILESISDPLALFPTGMAQGDVVNPAMLEAVVHKQGERDAEGLDGVTSAAHVFFSDF